MTNAPYFQCEAITEKGTRCKHSPVDGTKFCWMHDGIKRNVNQTSKVMERMRRNNLAKKKGTKTQSEQDEEKRDLEKDIKKYAHNVLDWHLKKWKLSTDGDKPEKQSRLKVYYTSLSWKKICFDDPIEEVEKWGKIFKIKFPLNIVKYKRLRLSYYVRNIAKGKNSIKTEQVHFWDPKNPRKPYVNK